MNQTFLNRLAIEVISQFQDNIPEITIVLPNKRAKVFLVDEIQMNLSKPTFSPKIISIEELIEEISQLRSIDSLEVLFQFYQVYGSFTDKNNLQDFETFSLWAKTLLQDFNEIDRYLLDQNHVFSYLKEVEALKRWNLEPKDKTTIIDSTLDFWHKLPLFYDELKRHLLEQNIGYQGLLYRESIHKLEDFEKAIVLKKSMIFAGFNALNQAEEKIFQHLILKEKAQVFWDIDYSILQDYYHDSGLFIRKYKDWKLFQGQPLEWVSNHFEQTKNIQIIGTPKTIGQTKIAGNIIEDLQKTNVDLQKTAIVLGDENLLLPILFNLPDSVQSLNITMGYPSKNNPAQLLISKIFKLHLNALQRDEKNYTLYYKEVLDVLGHSLIQPYVQAHEVEHIIKFNNFTFFSHKKLYELYQLQKVEQNPLFDLLFSKWNNNGEVIVQKLISILLYIKSKLSNETQEEVITKSFLHAIYEVLNRLSSYISNYQSSLSVKGLYAIYKQVIDLAEVSLEGKPLTGLQIMGVLESRVLDFENVIITSVNEGKFPSGKSQNTFIPYDVKKELGLPTYREKDAIYSYHFYHLLYRAKNIYLLYNSDNEGIDAGEKSRFITQLEIDFPKHITKNSIYNAHLPSKAYEPLVINKTTDIIDRLNEIASGKGFSPSSLTSYIRNPIQFYTQRVLRISDVEEVEESIAVNTLGTIIHETLKHLYIPYIDSFLTENDIQNMKLLVEEETIKQFKIIYKEGEIKKGKNLLAFEVAKQNIEQFLAQELNDIQNGDAIKILFLEQNFKCSLLHTNINIPVFIGGNVDRIEIRNNRIRIIDYKSGKVEANSLKINDFIDVTKDIKNEKIIQLLCYALMFQEKDEYKNYEVEAGIVSFKNMKAGFMPFGLGKGRNVVSKTIIDEEILNNFKEELVLLVNEILNPEIPFEEKV